MWSSGGLAPRILNLGARWGWIVSFTLHPLFFRGNFPRYSMDRRLGGPQCRCGRGGEEKYSQPLPRVEHQKIRKPFEKFVDSPSYSESELCGGAMTFSFLKYLPWRGIHFLQRFTHFSKTCCRPLITSKFVASELRFRCWKSSEIAWGEIWAVWRMF
jgi:hypothetical protein